MKKDEFKLVALYGLGTETKRLISQWGSGPKIIGLLDGFKEEGEAFGYPIISLQQAITAKIDAIIVVARPGSCKVIAKRIKETCIENNIAVFDVRGNDLFVEPKVTFDFTGIKTYKFSDLITAIKEADVVSFDLFNTLISRKLLSYTDLFSLMEYKLAEKGMPIKDFATLRLKTEKELSVGDAPTLETIYDKILIETGINSIQSKELVDLELSLDLQTLQVRTGMKELLSQIVELGKKIIVITDTYYSNKVIESILYKFGLNCFDMIFVSCEYHTSKADELFEEVKKIYTNKHIIHIGDDDYVDIEKANCHELSSFKIYGKRDMFEKMGGLGLEDENLNYSDRVKLGLFASRIFSSPFIFESDNFLKVEFAKDIGYLFCGPILMDFALWFNKRIYELEAENVLLCARDGFLLKTILEKVNDYEEDKGYTKINIKYFLTSRVAAIRAGICDEADIEYVDSMKFFGSEEESLQTRFGIELCTGENRNKAIIKKAKGQRVNYKRYINSLGLTDGKTAVFDFVAKGTTQLFLQKIMTQQLIGLYFLQLEPEFMADKNINIEAFYTEAEKNKSVIFDNYYILETILTSPMPSVNEFDEQGNAVYAKETRTKEDIECVRNVQQGILDYLDEYLLLVPETQRKINKMLDEKILSLVSKIRIQDTSFNKLMVEDPFFGRMTKITDVL